LVFEIRERATHVRELAREQPHRPNTVRHLLDYAAQLDLEAIALEEADQAGG
jgi:hypothetical protein